VTVVDNPVGDLDNGVTGLLWGYGNQISLTGTNTDAYLIGGTDPQGLPISAIGVAAPSISAVPLPAGGVLLISGFGLLALSRRRSAKSLAF